MIQRIQANPKVDKFYVIAVISNPARYESRYQLYREFKARMIDDGATVITVEMAFGDRPFEITERDSLYDVQVRSYDEYWHKESLINIGINYLCQLDPDFEYAAWIDADVEFVNRQKVLPPGSSKPVASWINETVQALQHHMVVQMFQNAIDLGPKHETLQAHSSFMYCYATGKPYRYGLYGDPKAAHWHPGFAWAARREALDAMGGMSGPLLDTPILGAADNHMSHAWVGMVDRSFHPELQGPYVDHLKRYQDRCEYYLKRDVGYVPGTLLHHWHGKKKDRKYWDRWRILVDNDFNPELDLRRDAQGLWTLDVRTPRQIKLRDQLRSYLKSRQEDSIDLE